MSECVSVFDSMFVCICALCDGASANNSTINIDYLMPVAVAYCHVLKRTCALAHASSNVE